MVNLANNFKDILENFQKDKENHNFPDSPLAKRILKDYNNEINDLVGKYSSNPGNFLVKSSVGRGKWVTNPWTGVMDFQVSNTFKKGFMFGYSYQIEDKKVYFRLSQGYEEFKNNPNELKRRADILKSKISNIPEEFKNKNNLLDNGDIIGKCYNIEDLNNETLENDFKYLFHVYEILVPEYLKISQDLSKDFKEILNNYKDAKNKPFKNNPLLKKINNDFSKNFHNLFYHNVNNSDFYKTKISAGYMGNFAENPWAGILNKKVSTTFQDGLYIIFLFKTEENGIYLSLDQGSSKTKHDVLVDRANMLIPSVNNVPEGFTIAEGKVSPESIMSKFYSYDDLNDKVIIKDLKNLMEVYEDLIPEYMEIRGDNIVENPFDNQEVLKPQNVWKLTPGVNDILDKCWNDFLENDYTAIGWLCEEEPKVDYTTLKTKDDIQNALKEFYGETNSPNNVKAIYDFTYTIKKGDIIISNAGYSTILGVGVVTSDYIPPHSSENPSKNCRMSQVRKVDWIFKNRVDSLEKLFDRKTLTQLKPEKWAKIYNVYFKNNGEELLDYLFSLFKKEYLDTDEGKNHLNHYDLEKQVLKDNLRNILNDKGDEVYHKVCDELIATLPEPTIFGGFYSVENKLRSAGYTTYDLKQLCSDYLILLQVLLESTNREEKDKAIVDFANKGYLNIQSGITSPALYLLDSNYLFINNKVKDTCKFLGNIIGYEIDLDTSIKNYLKSNRDYKKFLDEISIHIPEFKDYKLYDMFCHWCVDKNLGNFAGNGAQFLPIIKPNIKTVNPPKLGDDEIIEVKPVEITVEAVEDEVDLEVDEKLFSKLVASLNAGNHIIMEGVPGTGKTELAISLSEVAKNNSFIDDYILTTATSDWTTFDTIGGLMPDSHGKLIFKEGKFLQSIRNNDWLIIDEINRSDIDKAFGQLFTVLSGQDVELPYELNGMSIKIIRDEDKNRSYFDEKTSTYVVGNNWRIIATMNVYDKDYLYDLSYAFMRRFMFINVSIPSFENYKNLISQWCEDLDPYYEENLIQLLNINNSRELGPAIFKDMVKYIISANKVYEEFGEPIELTILREAVLSYIIPQFEGLTNKQIEDIQKIIEPIFGQNIIYDKLESFKVTGL